MRFDEVAGSWTGLMDRLAGRDAWAAWTRAEPALSVVAGAAGLRQVLARGGDRDVGDAVLGALVRLAAADGGDDADAVLLVLHLLEDGARSLAAKIGHRTRDGLAVVLGELTCQVRRFPWRRRTRAYAANLLLDTKHALWVGEFRPLAANGRPDDAQPIDPAALLTPALLVDRWRELAVLDQHDDTNRLDLPDLLRWAEQRGVASGEDLTLLWESEVARDHGGVTEGAAQRGVGERRDRRRRARTLAALRRSSSAYLAAVA